MRNESDGDNNTRRRTDASSDMIAMRFHHILVATAAVAVLGTAVAERASAAESTGVSTESSPGVAAPSVSNPAPTRPPAPTGDDWEFAAIPYVWGIAIDGNATVDGFKSDIDASFGDLLEELNIAVMGQFEARKGRFGAFVNPVYARLTSKNSQGQASVRSTGTLFEMDFAGYYRVGEWHLGDGASDVAPKVAVEPYVGGRLWYLDAELKTDRLGSTDKDKAWVDPIGGVRTLWDITPKWNLVLQADVGGFGASSDLTWQAMGLAGYRFDLFAEDDANLLVGYRALYVNYKSGRRTSEITGERREKFGLDATLHGPLFGLSVRF